MKIGFVGLSVFVVCGALAGCDEQKDEDDWWRIAGSAGMTKFILIDKSRETDLGAYEQISDELCDQDEYCFLMFWSNPAMIPTSLPMTEQESLAQLANYTANPTTAFREMLYNCRILPDPTRCFSE